MSQAPAAIGKRCFKGRILYVGLVVLVAVGLPGWFLLTYIEPAIDGAPASYWVDLLGAPQPDGDKAVAALDALGLEKATPYLVEGIGRPNKQGKMGHGFYRYVYGWMPGYVRQRLPLPPRVLQPGELLHRRTRISYYLANAARKNPSQAALALEGIKPLLMHTNSDVRFAAALSLTSCGTNAAPVLATVQELLDKHPDRLNDPLLKVIEGCKPASLTLVPGLKRAMSNTTSPYRMNIARTPWILDHEEANAARQVALDFCSAADAGKRMEAASLLWRIDKNSETVVPVLIGLLRDKDQAFEYRTILLLKQMGPAAKDAVPALEEWVRNTSRAESFVKDAASQALQRMTGADQDTEPK